MFIQSCPTGCNQKPEMGRRYLHNVGVCKSRKQANLQRDFPHLLVLYPAVLQDTGLAEELHYHLVCECVCGEGGGGGGGEW